MSLPPSRAFTRRVQQQEADFRRIDLLIQCGALEPEEQDAFEDMRRELEARKVLRRDAVLSEKQRSWCDRLIRKLGLVAITYASGTIPEGRRVDHLDGVPGAFRKPLKPPPARRA